MPARSRMALERALFDRPSDLSDNRVGERRNRFLQVFPVLFLDAEVNVARPREDGPVLGWKARECPFCGRIPRQDASGGDAVPDSSQRQDYVSGIGMEIRDQARDTGEQRINEVRSRNCVEDLRRRRPGQRDVTEQRHRH